jgi:hypothetical protein
VQAVLGAAMVPNAIENDPDFRLDKQVLRKTLGKESCVLLRCKCSVFVFNVFVLNYSLLVIFKAAMVFCLFHTPSSS